MFQTQKVYKIKIIDNVMIKKLVLVLAVCFLLLQVVNATETEIKVKTHPFHEVQVAIMDFSSGGSSTLQRFINNSDEYGDVNFSYSSNELEIDLIVFIKKDNERVIHKQFNEKTEEPIYIELAKAGFEFIETPVPVNETLNATIDNSTIESNETETEIIVDANVTENKFAIAGFVVFGEEGLLSKKVIYYFFGIIVFLIIVFFALKVLKKKLRNSKNSGDKGDGGVGKGRSKEETIEDAERKIKEAREEIEEIKNENKIRDAKKKLIEDEKELIRLRKEKDNEPSK